MPVKTRIAGQCLGNPFTAYIAGHSPHAHTHTHTSVVDQATAGRPEPQ